MNRASHLGAVAHYNQTSFRFDPPRPTLSHSSIIDISATHSVSQVGRDVWNSVLTSGFRQVTSSLVQSHSGWRFPRVETPQLAWGPGPVSDKSHSKISSLYLLGGSFSATCGCCLLPFHCVPLKGAWLCCLTLPAGSWWAPWAASADFCSSWTKRHLSPFSLGVPQHGNTNFLWTHSSFPVSLLYQAIQHQTQHSRGGLTINLTQEKSPPSATSYGTWLVFITAGSRCWLNAQSAVHRSPGPLLAKAVPQPAGVCPLWKTLHLSFSIIHELCWRLISLTIIHPDS